MNSVADTIDTAPVVETMVKTETSRGQGDSVSTIIITSPDDNDVEEDDDTSSDKSYDKSSNKTHENHVSDDDWKRYVIKKPIVYYVPKVRCLFYPCQWIGDQLYRHAYSVHRERYIDSDLFRVTIDIVLRHIDMSAQPKKGTFHSVQKFPIVAKMFS